MAFTIYNFRLLLFLDNGNLVYVYFIQKKKKIICICFVALTLYKDHLVVFKILDGQLCT